MFNVQYLLMSNIYDSFNMNNRMLYLWKSKNQYIIYTRMSRIGLLNKSLQNDEVIINNY